MISRAAASLRVRPSFIPRALLNRSTSGTRGGVVRLQQSRKMASASTPAGEAEGFETRVRNALGNKDEHVVVAILAGYFGLYLLSTLFTGGGGGEKKEEANVETAVVSAVGNSTEAPSVDSPEFENWVNTPGNIEKLVESWESK
eukprot:475637_1